MGRNNKKSSRNRRKEKHDQWIEQRDIERLYEEAKKLDPNYLNTVEGQMYGNIDAIDTLSNHLVEAQCGDSTNSWNIFSRFYPSSFFSWILVY